MAVPGLRQEARTAATFSQNVLDSPETHQCIRLLRELVTSCFGPHGRLKSLQNSCGGHLTLTSSSQRLFSAVSLSKPVLKLVVGSVQAHLSTHRDGGLFATILSLNLIEAASSLPIHKRLVVDVFDGLLNMIVDYLKSKAVPCKFSLRDTGLKGLLMLTRTIVGTKPLCCLYGADLDHIVQLLVEAFLKSLPDSLSQASRPENVHFVTVPGRPISECRLFLGVLLDLCGRGSLSPACQTWITDCADSATTIPVALVDVSMSGDLEDFVEGGYELSDHVNVEAVSSSRLQGFAQAMVRAGAKVVFCQRVVCPEIKTYLRDNNVFVVDRLGAAACNTIYQLTGARLISVVSESIAADCLGQLTSLSVQVVHDRSYLLLSGLSSSDITLVLSHRQGESTEELKAVCESAIQSLYLHLYEPEVLSGGGCWQTHLAHWLRLQVTGRTEELMGKYYCTKSQLLSMMGVFCHSLELSALLIGGKGEGHMVDSTDHHVWRNEGLCGEGQGDVMYPMPQTCSCGQLIKTETTRLYHLVKNRTESATYFTEQCHKDGKSIDNLSELTNNDTGFMDKSQDLRDTKHHLDNFKSFSNNQESYLGNLRFPQTLTLVDSFPVQLSALQTAVTSANAVLGICQYIRDTN